ncbi:MAG: hypothetical protein HZB41_06720 [Ignavibacteriae bacterium]|nr:hypothetical protein [Ignavibacteriota bacterium]
MRKFINLVLIISLCLTQELLSQQDTNSKSNIEIINIDSIARNAWYIEIMGNTWSLSFNYDRSIFIFPTIISNYSSIILRIGIGINLLPSHIPIPLMLLTDFGKIHKVELGVGLFYDYLESDWNEGFTYPHDKIKWMLNIGYRYQKPEGGFVCRTGFTPFFTSNKMYWLWGLSFGYAW